jgi:hypothetical protein
MKFNYKALIPHVSAVVLFLVISFAYFPDMLDGKQLSQHDNQTWRGMAKEIEDYKKETGEHSLWTNSMFGGMPTYLINTPPTNNVFKHLNNFLNLNHARPAAHVFLYLIGFYIALIFLRINPWLAFTGALAYAFSSYFFIIIAAGHTTKVIALGYVAPIIVGAYLTMKKKYLAGGLLFSIALSIQLLVNHIQITYYTLIVVLVLAIIYAVNELKAKRIKDMLVAAAILIAGLFLAVGTNASSLLTVYEYGKYSTRGKSELTSNSENKTAGLDRDYVVGWSYGKMETFNLLIPNFKGGASVGELDKDSKTYEVLKKNGVQGANNIIKGLPLYWGTQPSTSGPVYIGAVICFLFIFGLFIVDRQIRVWMLIVSILAILLSWGKNMMWLTNLFLDYFPGYNKFRVVSMILVVVQFAFPFTAILALQKMISEKIKKDTFFKALKWSFGITAGLSLFFALIGPGMFSFESANDARLMQSGWPDFLIDALREDRGQLLRADAFRSFVFISLSTGVLWYFFKEKLSFQLLILSLSLLVLVDLWPVNKRYLNSDNFIPKKDFEEPYKPTQADNYILGDAELNFRVLNMAVSTFNDASTSYFHKSLGGYHGAKMKRYQELIEHQLSQEMSKLGMGLNARQNPDSLLQGLQVINMLNTKYLVVNPSFAPIENTKRYGQAWFVDNIKIMENADEEIAALSTTNLKNTALVDKRYEDRVQEVQASTDSTANIKLVEYKPNYLKYKSNSSSEKVAVFSEIYYPKGWYVTINGEKADHFRANYLLRAMVIPAGENIVEFRFDPKIYKTGRTISMASSVLLLLLLLGGLAREFLLRKAE